MKSIAAACIWLLSLSFGMTANDGLSLPLVLKDEKPVSMLQKALIAAHRMGAHSNLRLALMSNVSLPLVNVDFDVEYYVVLEVGTPGQKFKLNIDTGSADFWIYSVDCKTPECLAHSRFNYSSSRTYKPLNKKWSMAYVDGSYVSGYQACDNVNIGGLVVKNQRMGLAISTSEDFKEDVIDGMVGLSFQSVSRMQSPPLFHNMIAQNLLSKPIFSVWLGKRSEGGDGEITFGGTNPAHYKGNLTWSPVVEQRYWSVFTDGVIMNGKFIKAAGPAIVDTGSTILILPSDVANKVHGQIPGSRNDPNWGWIIPCESASRFPKMELGFRIGGKFFNIPLVDLIREPMKSNKGMCFSAIIASISGPWLLGAVFIKNNYCVFDAGRLQIGIAPAKR
ncbi:uncharacterized protein VTP21DRAFT_4242 [Calcarisporiella thermophila]|uniref:uncharacterized protein n=1 Tax=Calcarisporiella thermophila TaxID=911321 RepID=UPI003743121C